MIKKEFKSGIAFDEDVLERALEILKKRGVETDIIQLKRVYENSTKVIQEKLSNGEYCSINLEPLGHAYYQLIDLNKLKTRTKNTVDYNITIEEKHREVSEKRLNLIEEKVEEIKEEYERRRTGVTVSKDNILAHIIQNLRRAIKRRKITFEEVEETQNNIQ